LEKSQIPDEPAKPKGTGFLGPPSYAIPGSSKDPAVISVPVLLDDQASGLLEIIDETPYRDWTDDERRLVEEIADQLSLALENAQLFEQTQRALDETELQAQRLGLLNEMSEELNRATKIEDVYKIAAKKTAEILPADRVTLARLDPSNDTFELIALEGEGGSTSVGTKFPVDQSAVGLAVRERRLISVYDKETSELDAIKASLVAPLIASGRITGTINVGKKNPAPFTKRDENLLLQVASLLASTIESRRLFHQTEFALAETEALFQASAALNSVQSYEDILTILRKFTVLGDNEADFVTIMLYDRPWQGEDIPEWQSPICSWSENPDIRKRVGKRFPLRNWAPAMELFRSEVATIFEKITGDPRFNLSDLAMFEEFALTDTLLFTPLNYGGLRIGHIQAGFPNPISTDEANIRRLMALASQAAVAIENLHLLEETRQRASQLQTAAEIARDASETLAVEELLDRAVKLICNRFDFYHVSVYLLDDDGKDAVIRASTGKSGDELKRTTQRFPVGSESVVGYVTHTGPLVLNDVHQDDIYKPNPLLPDTQAELGIPLKVGDRIIGALDVQSTSANPFAPDDVAVLQTLADQIAVAVDNARSYELAQNAFQEARRRFQELSMLYNVSQSFASAPLEIEEIAQIVARQFVKVLDVPECSISMLEEDSKNLKVLVDIRTDGEKEIIDLEAVGKILPLANFPSIVEALESRTPIVIDLQDPEIDISNLSLTSIDGYAQLATIPLAAKGQPIGAIEVKTYQPGRLEKTDVLNLAMTLANQAAVTLENARLYEEQRHTANQLRELDTLKSQFIANMSHELRTPLNSIIGFSRVILKGIDGPVTGLQEQDLTAIYNAGQHLLGLINDILDLSKIEAGKMELSFEPVDISQLIDSVMATAEGLVKHKPIQLKLEVTESLPPVNADPLRVRQVLLNLLSNAAKFTEEGSITVSANLHHGANNQSLIVTSVADTGPGISPADQAKLFQPFSQVDASPSRKSGGSGLGLSISRHLIDMHHGQIRVKSALKKGSTFQFSLPVHDLVDSPPMPVIEAPVIIKPIPEEPAPQPEISATDKVILSVDPDAKVINLYDRYLKSEGFKVYPVTDPSQTIKTVREVNPEAITLDVMTPNGWKILQSLKENSETAHIPVIICSILDEREKGLSLGASDYLIKPILQEDLIQAIAQLEVLPENAEEVPGVDFEEVRGEDFEEVLIIDNDPADVRLLQILLHEHTNCRVFVAEDGQDALEKIHSKKPDTIILNHILPDMDAFTFLSSMRTDALVRDIPIIILTDDRLPMEQIELLARNTYAHFSKRQLDKQEFLVSLRKAINYRKFYK
jgi:signal transduction histidine kinase/DNA-binding response OmpR family regulator